MRQNSDDQSDKITLIQYIACARVAATGLANCRFIRAVLGFYSAPGGFNSKAVIRGASSFGRRWLTVDFRAIAGIVPKTTVG